MEIQIRATDIDGDALIIRKIVEEGVLEDLGENGVLFTDNEDSTAVLRIVPSYDFVQHPESERSFTVILTAIDERGETAQIEFQVIVHDVNREPVFVPTENQSISEEAELTFTVNAIDADGDILVYDTVGDLPAGATFADQTFTWTPGNDQAGDYPVTFTVTDGSSPVVEETITITVNNVNRAPVLSAIGNQAVEEGELLTFEVSATDADGDILIYDTVGVLPDGATFVDQTFTWTPTNEQSGNYGVTFSATDGDSQSIETITIVVSDVNRLPILGDIGDRVANEGETLTFEVTATDADGDALVYDAENLPEGADFVGQTFMWTPGYNQAGKYQVTFVVSDGQSQSAEIVTITVGNVNQGVKMIISTPVTNAKVGELYTYKVSVPTDQDGDDLSYYLAQAPKGMVINQNGLIQWTPQEEHNVNVIVGVSDGESVVSQRFTIQVVPLYRNVKIASARLGQSVVYPGDYLSMFVSLKNNGAETLRDMKATVMVYDLGMRQSSGEFNLAPGESASEAIHLWLPYDTLPGDYLVEVTLSNSLYHETVYRQVTVI